MSGKRDFGEKMGDWFRHILSCCDREEDEEARPALQIVSLRFSRFASCTRTAANLEH